MSRKGTLSHGWMLAVAITFPLIAACGGGGSSSNGNGNGNDVSDSLPERDSLASDADNHDLLYYYTTAGTQGLHAAIPDETGGSPATEMADDEAEGVMDAAPFGANEFIRYNRGDWDSSAWRLDDWAIGTILYPRPAEEVAEFAHYYRLGTEATSGVPTPERVSDYTGLGIAGGAPRRFVEFNYANLDEAGMVYPGSDDWQRVLLGDGKGDSPDEFSTEHDMVATVPNLDAGTPGGYLVLDGDTLVRLDAELDEIGAPQHEGSPVAEVDRAWMLRNLNDVDSGAYVALMFDDADIWEVWVYSGTGSHDGLGTIAPVTDSNDEVLELRSALTSQPSTAGDDQTTATDEATYLGLELGDDADPTLVRLAGADWEVIDDDPDAFGGLFGGIPFVIHAEGRIVWAAEVGRPVVAVDPDTGDTETLDANDNGDLSTTVPVSRDGWVFYNREDSAIGDDIEVAVAAHIDGSDMIELHDARWIGASTDGVTETVEFLPRPSEVFLLRDPGTSGASLAAVEAADPAAGLVDLGDLPESATDARMFGPAPGPHRLLQMIDTDTSPELHWVGYVDTREEGSLELLTTPGTTDAADPADEVSRPLDNF